MAGEQVLVSSIAVREDVKPGQAWGAWEGLSGIADLRTQKFRIKGQLTAGISVKTESDGL